MNAFITLDGNKYTCPGEAWSPEVLKPSTIRITTLGDLDTTYGPANFGVWGGFIRAYVTPSSGFGTPAQLRTSLQKQQGLSFTDHYGVTRTIHVQGYKEKSATVMWDGTDNYIDFAVALKGKI